jgi:hypothetical protein
MNRRHKEGLCLYCGKGGHFASNGNQKKNNHCQSGKGNHPKARCFKRGVLGRVFRTEQELGNWITSISSNQVTPRSTEQITLEAYVMVNGDQAKALFDTGTIAGNLMSGKFVSTNWISTENLAVPISLTMALKGSRLTINYWAKPVIQISSELGEITEAWVTSLENYNIFLGMPYLNCHQAVIDCGKATIMFPKTEYVLQCQRGI